MKNRVLAVIPARGGSKRIPKKNSIPFANKPMLAWTIEAIKNASIEADIVVSTDDIEIKEVAEFYGAQVPFLRDQHADDISTVSQVTTYVVNELSRRFERDYDHVIQLMPNCPLRTSAHIDEMYHYFLSKKCVSLLSCFKFGWMNPWWAFKQNTEGQHEYLHPHALKMRSQDLEELYCPTGAIWMAHVKELRATQNFYMDGHQFYPIPWEAAMDIDDYADLKMAHVLHILQNETETVNQ